MSKARILVFDLETFPALAYVWGLHDQNIGVEQIERDQNCCMWAAKWVGEDKVMSDALIDHPTTYRDNRFCDKQIAKSLRKLLDAADVVVTQNGERFDIPWSNTLFIKHDIPKPSKFYSVDLLRESRANYYSISHKLDFRGRQLALGSKMTHEGFKLWKACMDGNKAAWGRMIDYCKRDVELTEAYYLKLRPRMKNHPNVNMFERGKEPFVGRLKCPACSSSNIIKTGYNFYSSGKRQRYTCKDCGYRMSLGGKIDSTTKVVFRQE